MQLWQKIIVIPMSIVLREKGFSKQNAIKNHLQAFFEVGYFERFDESFIITLRWTTWIRRQTLRCERT